MKFKVEMKGLDKVQRNLGRRAANRLSRRIDNDLENGIDDMAEQAYDNAPVLTGALRSSILASVRKEGHMNYIFGSHLPYARRQEYEHNGNKKNPEPKRFYFRRAVIQEKPRLESKIGFTVRHVTGGR